MNSVEPVIIVGGGPVGLAMALELDHHGLESVVVEPRLRPDHDRPRAKTVSGRTMEHLRRWGIAEALREAAPIPADWSSRVTFSNTVLGDEVAHIDGCLGLDTPASVSPERGQQISQGRVEEVFRAAVAARPGIRTLWGWTATSVTSTPDSGRVMIESAEGKTRDLTARWIVGADGSRSVVRRSMNVRYEGDSGGRPNVNITFRSRELGALIPHPRSIHYWSIDPAAPGVVGPLDLDGTWWAIATGTESIESEQHAIDLVQGLVGVAVDVEVLATDPWQARLLLAASYRKERLFLVGDAAHQNPPWGGHGFNTGIGDAVNLGWKLAAVEAGWGPAELLDSFEAERRPVARRTIEVAASNMSVLSNDLADTFPEESRKDSSERIRRLKSPEFHADGLVFGYGYGPRSSDQAPDASRYIPLVDSGNRLPHRLANGAPLFDSLGPEFTVLGPRAATASLRSTAASRGVPFEHLDTAGAVVIVRPDQHIGWVGDSVEDADEVLDIVLQGFPVQQLWTSL